MPFTDPDSGLAYGTLGESVCGRRSLGRYRVAVDPAELIEQNGSQEVRRSPPHPLGRTAAGTPGPTPSKDHPCHACARLNRACATLPLRPGGTLSSNIVAMTRRGWSDSRGWAGRPFFADSVICAIGTICSSATAGPSAARAGESYPAGPAHAGPLPSSGELVVARCLPPGQQGGTATLTFMQAGATFP